MIIKIKQNIFLIISQLLKSSFIRWLKSLLKIIQKTRTKRGCIELIALKTDTGILERL